MASSALARAPRRAWATIAAVVVASGMVVAQSGIFTNVTDSVDSVVSTLSKVDFYVSASDGTSFADVRLPGGWEKELVQIPGVANVGINYFTFIQFRNQKVLLQGLTGSIGEAPAVAHASAEDRRLLELGEGAIVSKRFTELYGVNKGDTLEVPTPVGIRPFKVLDDAPQFTWERGHITIGRKAILEYFHDQTVSDYMVSLAPGARPSEVRSRIQDYVRGSPVPVHIISGSQQLQFIRGTVDQVNALFRIMSFVVVIAASLAIFNALLISVVERRRELGIMRAIGTSRRQLRSMIAVEACALGMIGGAIGILMGFLLHRTSLSAVAAASGFPLRYEFLISPAAGAFVVGVGLALLGSLLPARHAANVNIIEAIGYE